VFIKVPQNERFGIDQFSFGSNGVKPSTELGKAIEIIPGRSENDKARRRPIHLRIIPG
jgi:hypothetical protein